MEVVFFLAANLFIVSSILVNMANHKANEPRVQLKVPVSFRDHVLKVSHAAGMDATVYLENAKVYYDRKVNYNAED